MKASLLAVAVVTLALGATEAQDHETGIAQGSPAVTSGNDSTTASGLPSLHEQFESIANRVRGFAGAYYDDDGVLVIAGTPGDDYVSMAAAIRTEVLSSQAADTPYRIQPARFTFAELAEFKRAAATAGVDLMRLGIDERGNRVIVGVRGDLEKAQALLKRTGIPPEAIIVQNASPITPAQASLQNTHGMWGGMQYQNVSNGGVCSVTVVGYSSSHPNPNYGYAYSFLSAAHCASDADILYQPTVAGSNPSTACPAGMQSNYVGVVQYVPPLKSGSQCPAGQSPCRQSDVFVGNLLGCEGLYNYAGYYASTNGDNTPLLSMPPGYSYMWGINNAPPVAGQRLWKVGRTTGKTHGTVLYVCQNYWTTMGYWLLCQDEIQTDAGELATMPGDSGAPVFDANNYLRGLLWGVDLRYTQDTIYTPMTGVINDIGYFYWHP